MIQSPEEAYTWETHSLQDIRPIDNDAFDNDNISEAASKSMGATLLSGVESRTTLNSREQLLPTSRSPYALLRSITYGQKSKTLSTLAAWRVGIRLGTSIALFVLAVNVIFTICAVAVAGIDESGLSTLYTGDCVAVSRSATVLHLIINILSTALLGASNYCIQCLVAPTRKEVDKAHRAKKWVDIGVPSLRNLRIIGWKRLLMCIAMTLCALPLHLVYNSIIFQSTFNNRYNVYSVSESFLDGSTFGSSISSYYAQDYDSGYYMDGYLDPRLSSLQDAARNDTLTRLEPAECIGAYKADFQHEYGDVLLVSSTESTSNNSFNSYTANWPSDPQDLIYAPYSWLCFPGYNTSVRVYPMAQPDNRGGPTYCADDGLCTELEAARCSLFSASTTNWQPLNVSTSYCLAEKPQQRCRLQFSLWLMILVIVSNLVKVVLMGCIGYWMTLVAEPLVTLGDAIASFTTVADPATSGRSNFSAVSIKEQWTPLQQYPVKPGKTREDGGKWIDATGLRARRLGSGTGHKRLLTCIFVFSIGVIALIVLVAMAIGSQNGLVSSALSGFGFDHVTGSDLIEAWPIASTGAAGVLQNVLIANTPQLAVSIAYVLFNAAVTDLALGAEWIELTQRHEFLRVSRPQGYQKKRLFLTLPYRYVIPMLVVFTLLHYMVSQSLYFVRVDFYAYNPVVKSWTLDTFSGSTTTLETCGYSTLGIYLIIALLAAMLLVLFILGAQKIPKGTALPGSCSANISASCHYSVQDGKLADMGHLVTRRPLRWGVVGQVRQNEEVDSVGHLAFSADEVGVPEAGRSYF